MSGQDLQQDTRQSRSRQSRLGAYVAATGTATVVSAEADAAIVANTTDQPFGINGAVNIDFNTDGQIDFQIDHDRVNVNGNDLDYLQIDKNDVNGASNPLAFDSFANLQAQTFPAGATTPNDANQSAYVIDPNMLGSYPAALQQGTLIGPTSSFDWQEGDNFDGQETWIRANRLIDEDATQIDQVLGGRPASGVQLPFNGPNFDGLDGEVRYLGLKMDLNDMAPSPATAADFNYGWIGVQITNEADATGVVTGWAYETVKGMDIAAGDTGPVTANADYDDDGDVDGNDLLVWQRALGTSVANGTGADGNGNGVVDGPDLDLWETQFGSTVAVPAGQVGAAAVPEPGTMLMAGLCAVMAIALCFTKRRQRKAALAPCRA
jgi:hypothetical protein